MSTYIKGAVCGTDNCPSRLWRIINGQRTCQYGHVMEGGAEFNDEEDGGTTMGVIKKRLNLTTNATGSFQSSLRNSQSQFVSQSGTQDKKLYGSEAKMLFLKCFQHVLKAQCNWLIANQYSPPEFLDVVKLLWMTYLKKLTSNDDEDLTTNTSTNSCDHGLPQRLNLSMTSSIAFLYLACIHMRIPAYPSDFIHWICSMNMPYFRSSQLLLANWRKQLPTYYLRILDGGKAPCNAQIYHKTVSIASKIDFKSKFNSDMSLNSLLIRAIMFSALPPEFYFYTKVLIDLVDCSKSFNMPDHNGSHISRPHLYPEVRIISYLIITVNWVLSEHHSDFNLHAWLYRPTSKSSMLLRMACNPSSQLSLVLSQHADSYLDWFQHSFLPMYADSASTSLDHLLYKRKLYSIIPLHLPDSTSSALPSFPASYIDQLQSVYSNLTDEDPTVPRNTDSALLAAVHSRLLQDLASEFALDPQQLTHAVHIVHNRSLAVLKSLDLHAHPHHQKP